VRLRLDGQLTKAKAAYEKLVGQGSHRYNTACNVVVLLRNEEKEELLKQYAETLKT
jgi:hypothetical protein